MTYTNNASSNIDHDYHNPNNLSHDQNPTILFLDLTNQNKTPP